MFIAMNRFRIHLGREEDFETIWRARDSHLTGVPGFQYFNLLRGATDETCTTYISHSTWESQDAFVAWTQSEAFRQAHAKAGHKSEGIYIGGPRFEGYTSVLSK
ncbi:MAG: antibiotic biosynthesis monooxygenase [Zetaproteobacteria bacterium]|nr:antibiotic biosynthesis monooxygenase [Zetaproteobacteria bacterium]